MLTRIWCQELTLIQNHCSNHTRKKFKNGKREQGYSSAYGRITTVKKKKKCHNTFEAAITINKQLCTTL